MGGKTDHHVRRRPFRLNGRGAEEGLEEIRSTECREVFRTFSETLKTILLAHEKGTTLSVGTSSAGFELWDSSCGATSF